MRTLPTLSGAQAGQQCSTSIENQRGTIRTMSHVYEIHNLRPSTISPPRSTLPAKQMQTLALSQASNPERREPKLLPSNELPNFARAIRVCAISFRHAGFHHALLAQYTIHKGQVRNLLPFLAYEPTSRPQSLTLPILPSLTDSIHHSSALTPAATPHARRNSTHMYPFPPY